MIYHEAGVFRVSGSHMFKGIFPIAVDHWYYATNTRIRVRQFDTHRWRWLSGNLYVDTFISRRNVRVMCHSPILVL